MQKNIQNYTFYVPIEGLEILNSSIEIGDITLYPSTMGMLLDKVLDKNRKFWDEKMVSDVKRAFDDAKSYMEVRGIEGDSEYGGEQTIQKCQNIIHILNFYLASSHQRNRGWNKIHIVGQPAYSKNQTLVYSADNNISPGMSGKVIAPRRYKIDDQEFQRWKKLGFYQILECLVNPNSSELEKRIERSVIWYSKAMNADGLDEQFIALSTAFESLLIGDEGKGLEANWGSINQRLSERVAFLLGHNYDERVELTKKVKTLYGLRSKIIHQGLPISEENLFDLSDIVRKSILTFVRQGFERWEDFLKWELEQKFSSTKRDDKNAS